MTIENSAVVAAAGLDMVRAQTKADSILGASRLLRVRGGRGDDYDWCRCTFASIGGGRTVEIMRRSSMDYPFVFLVLDAGKVVL